MASISMTMDGIGTKERDIDCCYCTKQCKCTRMPKKFGLFLRDCIYLTEVGFRCHLQEERNGRGDLVRKGIIKY